MRRQEEIKGEKRVQGAGAGPLGTSPAPHSGAQTPPLKQRLSPDSDPTRSAGYPEPLPPPPATATSRPAQRAPPLKKALCCPMKGKEANGHRPLPAEKDSRPHVSLAPSGS